MGSDPSEQDRRWSEWMALAQDGAQAPYGRLLKDCAPYVRARVRRRISSPEQVEDVVQEVLLTLHRVRHTYDPRRPFTPWLVAIIERRCADALRRRGRVRARETQDETAYANYPDPGAETAMDRGGDAEQVHALLQALPPGQRQALELVKLQELSLAEASAASGQSVGALKLGVHRAMKALRARLGGGR